MTATMNNPAMEFANRLSQLENCVALMLGVEMAGPVDNAPHPDGDYFTFEGEYSDSSAFRNAANDLGAELDAQFTRLNRVESLVGAYLNSPSPSTQSCQSPA